MGKFDGPEPEQWMEILTCDRCGEPVKAGQIIGLNIRSRVVTHEGPDLCEHKVIPAGKRPGVKGTPRK